MRYTCLGCGVAIQHGGDEHRCLRLQATDTEAAVFAGLERGKDFQICPSERCGRRIQLMDGCNHVTCMCGMQFCFICDEPAGEGSDHWSRRYDNSDTACPRYNHPSSTNAMFEPMRVAGARDRQAYHYLAGWAGPIVPRGPAGAGDVPGPGDMYGAGNVLGAIDMVPPPQLYAAQALFRARGGVPAGNGYRPADYFGAGPMPPPGADDLQGWEPFTQYVPPTQYQAAQARHRARLYGMNDENEAPPTTDDETDGPSTAPRFGNGQAAASTNQRNAIARAQSTHNVRIDPAAYPPFNPQTPLLPELQTNFGGAGDVAGFRQRQADRIESRRVMEQLRRGAQERSSRANTSYTAGPMPRGDVQSVRQAQDSQASTGGESSSASRASQTPDPNARPRVHFQPRRQGHSRRAPPPEEETGFAPYFRNARPSGDSNQSSNPFTQARVITRTGTPGSQPSYMRDRVGTSYYGLPDSSTPPPMPSDDEYPIAIEDRLYTTLRRHLDGGLERAGEPSSQAQERAASEMRERLSVLGRAGDDVSPQEDATAGASRPNPTSSSEFIAPDH